MSLHIINYKFIAAAALTASKTAIYRMTAARPSNEPSGDKTARLNVNGDTSVGVYPSEVQGKYFQTDLSFGLSENQKEFVISDAVCVVSKAKNIVKTSLVGLSGTIKEYISDGDYEVSITVGLVAMENGQIVDKYPADGVQDLHDLLDRNEALYVNSDFLQLFDITRLVVVDYSIQQMTHGNYQIITINAISDDDYTIKSNEY